MSSALSTGTTSTKSGGSKETGPDTSVTCAPRCIATLASAYPILPVERLEIKRTGSIASTVGPAVTSTFLPSRSFSKRISRKIYSNKTSSDGSLPAPTSLQAKYPTAGAIIS